jgi:hypothetical protein
MFAREVGEITRKIQTTNVEWARTRVNKFDGFYQNSLKFVGFGPNRIQKLDGFTVHKFKCLKNQEKYYKK